MNDEGSTALAKLSAATRALAEAGTLEEIKQIRDIAAAAQTYAAAAHLGLEAQNNAAEIKLRAERKAGELLAQLERDVIAFGGSRPHSVSDDGHRSEYTEVLEDTGTTRQDANRWQRIAELPPQSFDNFISETKAEHRELTTSGLLQFTRLGVHFSSESPDWHTPPHVIERVSAVLGVIDLDPCSNDAPFNVPAKTHYTRQDDGLSRPWFGRVYMNPPYGREIENWIDKLCESWRKGDITEAIALVPARTDTEWFRAMRQFPRCFIAGRLTFSNFASAAPFPSTAIYLGQRIDDFCAAFSDIGDIYELVSVA